VSSGNNITIQSCKIGTSLSIDRSVPNGLAGITISTPGIVLIGGEHPSDGNYIAYNGAEGVAITAGSNHTRVLSNYIYDNALDGIKVEAETNVALLDLSEISANGSSVLAVLQAAVPGVYLIQVFSGDKCDPSGSGEGRWLVGETTISLPDAVPRAFTIALDYQLMDGHQLTATVTCGRATSPFSMCLQFTASLAACVLCECDSSSGELVVNCQARGLRRIPDGLPANTQRLLMGRNPLGFMYITDPTSKVLAGLTQLVLLDLSHADLAVLPSDLLTGLRALRTLTLAGNQLEDLTMIRLEGTSLLATLDLSYNRLTAVPERFVAAKALVRLPPCFEHTFH